ncbi:putative pyruvate formate lyase activating enzyme [Lachnospiraceae bacterium XBB1006]|nr:putative pyruvate formate lyase activating enzyme [Lachnospiraceae bacterium XBB1006]
MENCNLCPRNCNVKRGEGQYGYCHVGEGFKIGRIAPHMWEEPCISGEKGSGAIFFAGCNMGCVYCQNEALSHGEAGKDYTLEALMEKAEELVRKGCHNINLVTPSHYVQALIPFLEIFRKNHPGVPVVYNTSSYEKVEALQAMSGLVDIYMPDLKYLQPDLAKRYSNAADYPEIAKAAIAEMVAQCSQPEFEEEQMIKGVLVRHLVLPGYVKESKEIIRYLYETYGNRIYLSIMNQYTPFGHVKAYPEINRTLREEEYEEVVDYAISIGVEQGFIQEGETCKESFIPEFI